MRIHRVKFNRAARQRGNRGSAVLVVLVLLAVMSATIIANTHTLHALKEELKLLNERQSQRLRTGAGR